MGEFRIHRGRPTWIWPPTNQWAASISSKPNSLSFMPIVTRHRQCQARRLDCRWPSREVDCQLGRAYLGGRAVSRGATPQPTIRGWR